MKSRKAWINQCRSRAAKKEGRRNGVLKWHDWERLGYRHELNMKAESQRTACRIWAQPKQEARDAT